MRRRFQFAKGQLTVAQGGRAEEQPPRWCCCFVRAVEKGLVYAKSHEWAKVEGDTATVGISDFAQARVCVGSGGGRGGAGRQGACRASGSLCA